MAATWTWNRKEYGVQSPDTGAVLQGIEDQIPLAPGEALQRVIARGALWGAAYQKDQNFLTAPFQFGCAASLWVRPDGAHDRIFYTKFTPARYDLGWQIVVGAGGQFYWTVTGTDMVDCDVTVRHKVPSDVSNASIGIELQMLLGNTQFPGVEGAYPAYQLFLAVQWLTSRAA